MDSLFSIDKFYFLYHPLWPWLVECLINHGYNQELKKINKGFLLNTKICYLVAALYNCVLSYKWPIDNCAIFEHILIQCAWHISVIKGTYWNFVIHFLNTKPPLSATQIQYKHLETPLPPRRIRWSFKISIKYIEDILGQYQLDLKQC